MSFTIDGRFIVPAARNVTVQDQQVLSIQSGDVRLNITSILGTGARLVGIDGATDGRILYVYNGLSATTVLVGSSTTVYADYVIKGNFTLNPRNGIWLRYFNEGPPASLYRNWIVLTGA